MDVGVVLLRVRALSDGELLLGLGRSLGVSRRSVADVVAHLGEVEQRRLHLIRGHSSLFAYCVSGLGMSEDEAYRRIAVAGLARRFPSLLGLLAAGRISLSVAALLKACLTEANHERLLAEVSGKTVQQAREVLATWFPQPDALPFIRKLPERRSPAAGAGPVALGGVSVTAAIDATIPATDAVGMREPGGAVATPASKAPPAGSGIARQPASSTSPAQGFGRVAPRCVEPLSAERYRVQLTAGVSLKRKLEEAQDLLRHAVPDGDLATIVERALDALIEKTLKRRFAVTHQSAASTTTTSQMPPARPVPSSPPPPGPVGAATPHPSQSTRYIPNEVRRTVFARDEARCTWQGPHGVRCNSRAWLEHDHVTPVAQGGGSDAASIRLFCRPHNRLAAEHAFGRDTIAQCIARRRARRASSPPPPAVVPGECAEPAGRDT